MKEIHIFAMAAQGKGISGGDRIFIEFARRWQRKAKVSIYVNEEGREMCRRQKLSEDRSLRYEVWDTSRWAKKGFVVAYFARIFRSIFEALRLKFPISDVRHPTSLILYSASEFWMDSLPAFILKLRFPRVTWAAAWYQTAPNPIKGFAEGQREETYHFKALLYWLAQFPIKPIVAHFADYVLINNEVERKQFPPLDKKRRTVIVIGAIDLDKIRAWQKSHLTSDILHYTAKKYDAVFQGRFHPQKGVVELIEIWKKVVDKKPDAKLAMIGDGPLMRDVRYKIKDLGLEKNVKLLGYVFDGDEKYRTFSQGRVVVHPALYDSGGMASAEAMAFGLPVVGFNLKAYESYYPKGMIKVKVGDTGQFANAVLDLLKDEKKRSKLAKEAMEMLNENWSWDKRAEEVLRRLVT